MVEPMSDRSERRSAALRAPLAGWPHQESPFHEGEKLAQERAGVGDKLEGPGRRMIRDHMPDEHRELFEKLPYLIAGAADDEGQLWATMLTGEAGFVRTPDERTLQIQARPRPGDPLAELLTAGRNVGLLGIELPTRRRNRVNGALTAVDAGGFTVSVRQSFGNCPQYIQARRPLLPRADSSPAASLAGLAGAATLLDAHLDAEALALIERADTCFLATATAGTPSAPSHGVDVSHRGGRPGFLAIARADSTHATASAAPSSPETWIVLPDYRGNFLFNTIGNLAVNPRAGLLVPDFETGSLLSLTGEAQVVWEHPMIAQLAGAQRLILMRIRRGVRVPGALPWRWSEAELAPQLRE
jgi:uncharacterized protein